MKIKTTVLIALGAMLVSLSSFGAELVRKDVVDVKVTEVSGDPQAVVINVKGNCEFSENGKAFETLKSGQVLLQGAVVRSTEGSRTDMFFRRIGTTVRLQPSSEIKLEKMTRTVTDGNAAMETLLDLRTGRIFTVVRSLIPGSKLEIRNAAGRSVVEGGGGKGRYIITADGTQVADKGSAVPIKLVRDSGVTIITPGQKFDSKEGKMFDLNPSERVESLIDFDELDALAEQASADDAPAKSK
jgi:hypothetical protein